jgi:tRNA pseudouridine55 synthase
VGHTGTLDPFATGLLVLLTGRATRLARFIEQQPKTYLATARLGYATTTDDRTGEAVGAVTAVEAVRAVRAVDLIAALDDIVGPQRQTPPAYSAKKVEGERSYRLARRGEEVALAPVEVTVHGIELIGFEPPLVTFRTTVSAGTYIRAMARDLGERLGVGAHLDALRRESIGAIRVEEATPLADLDATSALSPLQSVLRHLPAVELDESEAVDIGHGRPVARASGGVGFVQLVQNDSVIAVAREDGDWLRPVVVLEGK